MADLREEQRENWGSRTGFVLAAIGSAVGLGNLWGFPYKVYAYGGGAFLIPYLLAMLVIGIPLLILEFSLGHMTQRAAPDAYRGISRRTEPVGWWGIILGFVIITYYPVILAWCGSYLVKCVDGIFTNGGEVPWKDAGLKGVTEGFDKYLHSWPEDAKAAPWDFGYLVRPIVISLAVIWVMMYLCICRGVRLVSKVVLWTVPLPWIMLCVLTVRGLTLDGATAGLNYYLDPKWEALANPDTWRFAFGQMFFSMSLAFGVMITYASFLHRKSDINNNATIIGLADIGTSFVAGIAVFATLGAMAFATKGAATVENVVGRGPDLVFKAFPYALAQLDYSAWFGAVFFIALLTLGIDSAFSITESVLAAVVDKTRWNRGWTLIGISLVGFAMGLVYCTRGGMNWLGAMDSFISEPWGGIALLGLLECVVIGWAYRIKRLREHANERSDWRLGAWWDVLIRYVAPMLISALFAWSLLTRASSPGGFLYTETGVFSTPALVGVILAIVAPLLAVILSAIHSPGANTHAQHVGQPRAGRGSGFIGTLLVLGGLAAMVWCFSLSMKAHLDIRAGKDITQVMPVYVLRGYEVPLATVAGVAGGVLALLGVMLGAARVRVAERSDHRPSGFARFAAGAGVMTIGACGGLLVAISVLLHPTKPDKPPDAGASAAAAALEWTQQAAEPLSGASIVVLSIMVSILVVGLGWCFYRAIKAAGAGAVEEQLPEDS